MESTVYYKVHENVPQSSPEAWIVKIHPDSVP
jgi:hypothetical protein